MIKKIGLGLLIVLFTGLNVTSSFGQLLINEVMVNATGTCDGNCAPAPSEWTELINAGSTPIDVSCYIITDGDWAATLPQNTILQPGELFTIGSSNSGIANLNLNLETCGCTTGNSNEIGVFSNNNEQLVLAQPDGIVIDGLYWGNGQFSSTPSIQVASLFGCGMVTVNLDINDPALQQISGSIEDGESLYALCDGSGILVNGNTNPSPGALNFVPQQISPNANVQSEICPNTGSIDLTPSGNGPYEYAWQDALSGSTSNQVSGLTAGTWTGEITDNGQCGYTEILSFDVLDQTAGCVPPDSSVLDGNSSVLLLCSEGGSAYITDNGGASGNMTAQPGQSYQSLEICSDSWDVNAQLTLNNWNFNFNGLSGDLFMVYAGPFSEIEQYMGNNPLTLLTSPAAQNVVFNSMNGPVGSDSTLVVSDTCYTLITYHIPGFIPSPGFEAALTCVEPLSCLLDLSPIIVNDCDSVNQVYSLDFDIVLNNTVNDVYQVALSLDGIAVDTVDVTSGEVYSYTMSGIAVDAGANHVVFAEVLGSPGCNTEELYESVGCLFECNTLAGTGITGPTTRLLCFGQNQSWSATGEVVPSADVNDPNINYNPGMAWAIFTDTA